MALAIFCFAHHHGQISGDFAKFLTDIKTTIARSFALKALENF
jgi:hypothetical protein